MTRLKYLDGLRGIAALVVVFHHFMVAFFPSTYSGLDAHSHFWGFKYDVFVSHSFFNLFLCGNFAVCIFFVLSGMVLSRQFLITRDPSVLTEQAVRRYFRLIVPIFASVFIAFILVQADCFFHKPAAVLTKSDFWLGALWPHKYTVMQFLSIGLVDVLLRGENNMNNALWTMPIELFGSFLVFATLALTQYARRRFLIYGLLIFAHLWLQSYYYICFIAGIMMMDAGVNHIKWATQWRPVPSFGILVFALLLGSFPSGDPMYIGDFYSRFLLPVTACANLYHCIAAILLIAAIHNLAFMQRFLEAKPLLFLGRISFSMYLLHSLVLGSVIMFTFLHIYPSVSYLRAVVIVLPLYLALTLFFSYFFSRYIDEKSMGISKSIYTRYFRKTDQSLPEA